MVICQGINKKTINDISLSIIPSKSTHVVTNGKSSVVFMAEKYSIVCIHHILFIHSSVDGHRLFPYLGYCK